MEGSSYLHVNTFSAVLQNNRRTNSPMINLYNDKMTGKFKVRLSCPASVCLHLSSTNEQMLLYLNKTMQIEWACVKLAHP